MLKPLENILSFLDPRQDTNHLLARIHDAGLGGGALGYGAIKAIARGGTIGLIASATWQAIDTYLLGGGTGINTFEIAPLLIGATWDIEIQLFRLYRHDVVRDRNTVEVTFHFPNEVVFYSSKRQLPQDYKEA